MKKKRVVNPLIVSSIRVRSCKKEKSLMKTCLCWKHRRVNTKGKKSYHKIYRKPL